MADSVSVAAAPTVGRGKDKRDRLIDSIRAVKENFELVGAGLTEFTPKSPEQAESDLATILRIIGALSAK